MLFLTILFLIKTKVFFKNTGTDEQGLTYSTEILGNLVNKDTDGDGIQDWEEGLWGTDPNNKETTQGILDSVAIEKLKAEQTGFQQEESLPEEENEENLTKTDAFSREFFSTVATLNQNGAMDDATIEKLGTSLAEQIKNSTPQKIFTVSDIKIAKKDTPETVKIYNNALDGLQNKYPVKYNVLDVLQEFAGDENNINPDALNDLDPIIEQSRNIINDIAKISVPQSLLTLHLEFLNALERIMENLVDIQLYDTDTIVALSAISQYEKNTEELRLVIQNLTNLINQKLNS